MKKILAIKSVHAARTHEHTHTTTHTLHEHNINSATQPPTLTLLAEYALHTQLPIATQLCRIITAIHDCNSATGLYYVNSQLHTTTILQLSYIDYSTVSLPYTTSTQLHPSPTQYYYHSTTLPTNGAISVGETSSSLGVRCGVRSWRPRRWARLCSPLGSNPLGGRHGTSCSPASSGSLTSPSSGWGETQ